jgi:hypothetical protein
MNQTINSEVTYYKDPKYSSGPNKYNDRNSGANPFYLCLPGATHLIYENNSCNGQKYVTISKNTLPSAAAKTASEIAAKVTEKKTGEYSNLMMQKFEDEIKRKHEFCLKVPSKPSLIQGYQGKYYLIHGEKYDQHFPYEWAINHLSHPSLNIGSGPLNCENCKKYGSILTVFVGYCWDCNTNIYKGSRAGIKDALKTTLSDFGKLLPYMKDVRFKNIGDRKGWTLLKEREERVFEVDRKKKKDEEFEHSQMQKRNDLLIRTLREENVLEKEWDDYWGFQPVTNEDLFKWATSEYL